MNNTKIIDAAKEARIASAQTLTTHGMHSSIDDIPFIACNLSYDEVAESAFVKGAERLMTQPFRDRLTDEERERIREIYVDAMKGFRYGGGVVDTAIVELFDSIFGEEFFYRKNYEP